MGHHHLDKEQAAQIADARIHQVGGFEAVPDCLPVAPVCFFSACFLQSI